MPRPFAWTAVLAIACLYCGAALPAGTATTKLGGDVAAACAALTQNVPASAIGVKSGQAIIDSAVFTSKTAMAVADKGPTPASRISPATPDYCKIAGHIEPLDEKAPPITFEINLPVDWNGRAVQYGGGGFNGVLITGLGLPPAYPFDRPSPLALGYVTYGTDSGHQSTPDADVQAFAANDEAFANFAHLAYKKVRDVAVAMMRRAYGHGPEKLYYMGSSEGGREALTMAQRYPRDFDGIFARAPVINWTGLIHASWRAGLASMDDAYLSAAQVQLVHDAVLAQCDGADNAKDGIVADAAGCKRIFDVRKLACKPGQTGDGCLNAAQVNAVQTIERPFSFPIALANGLDDYPGWGVSGEATPASGPTGGWNAWWLGTTPPKSPPEPTNGIVWVFGSGAVRHIFARNPALDAREYKPRDHLRRILQVSNLMDSTNPDLSEFVGHGGKLIMLEHMADYAQSPYAGIRYFEAVQRTMGIGPVRRFMRLYTAPGVDHVGSGAPANIDMLAVLADWVERGNTPGLLQVTEQTVELSPKVKRSRPLCQWPQWPKYKSGDINDAKSFECAR
jgi:tannase/feruloyl esterase